MCSPSWCFDDAGEEAQHIAPKSPIGVQLE